MKMCETAKSQQGCRVGGMSSCLRCETLWRGSLFGAEMFVSGRWRRLRSCECECGGGTRRLLRRKEPIFQAVMADAEAYRRFLSVLPDGLVMGSVEFTNIGSSLFDCTGKAYARCTVGTHVI